MCGARSRRRVQEVFPTLSEPIPRKSTFRRTQPAEKKDFIQASLSDGEEGYDGLGANTIHRFQKPKWMLQSQ